VCCEPRLNTLHGGVVRAPQTSNGRQRKWKYASVVLDTARWVEHSQGRDHYIETIKNQRFSLFATQAQSAEQSSSGGVDGRSITTTGGLIKYAGVEVAKKGKVKQAMKWWLGNVIVDSRRNPRVNKDISLLLVEDGQYEAGTEVVKDIFCKTAGWWK